jgi:hypothetical protein
MTDVSLPPPLLTAGTRQSRRGRRAVFLFVSLVLLVALLLCLDNLHISHE